MPLPVIPGTMRIAVSGQIAGGGTWANVWHARNISLADWTQAGIEAFHAIFRQFYESPGLSGGVPVSSFLPTGTTVTKASYTPLDGSSGAYEFPIVVAGSGATPMPAEVAEVLTIRTALRGRQNRGRIYLPAFTTTHFDSAGHISTATINGILAQIVAVEAAIETGGAELGVGSYGPYKNPTTGAVSSDPAINGGSSPHFTPVSTWSMDNAADVQRGRKT